MSSPVSAHSVHLYYLFPGLEEGGLATYRTAIVQNQHLAMLAKVNPPSRWEFLCTFPLPLSFFLRGRRGKRVILSPTGLFFLRVFFGPMFVIGVKRRQFWRTELVRLGPPWGPWKSS